MKTRGFIVLSLLFLLSTSACAQSVQTYTSICELAKSREQMNGQRVRLSAIYLTDLLESSVLKDRQCPQQYLAPDWTTSQKNAPHDPSLDAFDKALHARPDDPKLTQFSIDVSGKFVWRTNEKPHGTLIFEKIWSFKRIRGDWQKAE